MPRNMTRLVIGVAALALLLALPGCRKEFDGPFTPGSGSYVGDVWAQDRDGDGLSDSLAKYLPACGRGPEKCLADAKALSAVWDLPRALSAGDRILWIGDGAARPELSVSPSELALRGWVFFSSDTLRVAVTGETLRPKAPGTARITARLAGDTLSASFQVKVAASGRRVRSLSAQDLVMVVGGNSAPVLSWNPGDAAYPEYSLASADPSVVLVLDNRLRALKAGIARVTARAHDGGSSATFLVTVGSPPEGPRVEALAAQDMIMVAGESHRAPILVWTPPNALNRGYMLLGGDTGIVSVSPDRLLLAPRRKGSTLVTAVSEDGGKIAIFTVTVIATDTLPPDNRPPVASIQLPGLTTAFTGGLPLAFQGSGQDPEDGALAASAASWEARLLDPSASPRTLLGPVSGLWAGSFIFPSAIRASTESVCRIVLKVTDSKGLTAMDSVDLRPTLGSVVLSSQPSGLTLGFDGAMAATPRSYPGVVGFQYPVSAPSPQSLGGKRYAFLRWSDGKEADHLITLPSAAGTLTATYGVMVDSVKAAFLRMSKGDPDRDPSLTWFPADAGNQAYTLQSLNAAVVTLVSGRLHVVGFGKAPVVVTTVDGAKKDTFDVLVAANGFTLTAKARDFIEQNNTGAWPAHPDFNVYGICPDEGYVKQVLDSTGVSGPNPFPGDERNPVFAGRFFSRMGGAQCYSQPSRFADWFTDRAGPAGTLEDINRPFLTDLAFTPLDDGTWEFRDKAYFPLDNRLPLRWRKIKATDPDPYGHLITGRLGTADLSQHNYGFTVELHAVGTYRAGTGQSISFAGDDDVWIFINGKIAVDMGGIHGAQTGTVDLDKAAASLGLADGMDFKVDLYFAERRVTESTCHIILGMELRQ